MFPFVAIVEDTRVAAQSNPPEPTPVVLVVVDEDCHVRARTGVLDPPELRRPFRLAVDGGVDRVAVECEDDRDEVRPPVRVGCRQPSDTRAR